MRQQNIPIGTLVDMYKRGALRLPGFLRHYVWRATRARDLLGSLYRRRPTRHHPDAGGRFVCPCTRSPQHAPRRLAPDHRGIVCGHSHRKRGCYALRGVS
jgi:hypothetical protein